MTSHSLSIVEVPCDAIRIGERHRKDLGDLETLAASIATEGLLQPIGITEENLLVFGERRLRACHDVLHRKSIPARVVRVRKDFAASERVAIGKALEAELGDRQGQRTDIELQRNCGPVPGRTLDAVHQSGTELGENVPEVPSGARTAEIAASRAGFGNRKTYEQAKKVVEKAVDEVIAQMDSGHLSIHAASVIAEQPPDQQREIAQLPEDEKKAAVRKLRRKDLPSTKEARRQAQQTGKAILDRNLMYQLPVTEEQKPLVEQNYAAMAIIDAITALSRCSHPAQAIAAAIRRLDTPDMDFAGRCSKAADYLNQINQEMNAHGNQ
jgi:ParB-like nuclease domain